jgi:hypothetical protein
LVGSLARGDGDAFSDVDLIIAVDAPIPQVLRAAFCACSCSIWVRLRLASCSGVICSQKYVPRKRRRQ